MNTIIPVTRSLIFAFALASAFPPMAKIFVPTGLVKIFRSSPAQAFPPKFPSGEDPDALKLPEGWRVEIPKRTSYLLPVVWDSTTEINTKNLTRTASKISPTYALSEVGNIEKLAIGKTPFGYGLAMEVKPTSFVAPSVPNPYTIILYSVLPEAQATTTLQTWADGKLKTYIALERAIPYRIDKKTRTIWALWATNFQPELGTAWDWRIESGKLQAQLLARSKASKSPEEDAKIAEEIKTAKEQGYDL